MLSSRDGHPSLLELTFRGRLIIRSVPTCRNDKPISKIIEIYHSGLGLVRQVAVFSLFVGVVLLAIGAFAFYVFLQSNLVDLGTLRVENQILVYICFLGVGLPLLVIGAGSLVNSWSDRLIRLVGFPASALSGAILCAIAIVSLPIFPTGYVTSVDLAGVSSTGPDYARPRLRFGFYDVYFMLGLGLLLLLVGGVLYGHMAKVHFSRKSFLNFVLAYVLVTVGVFLVLYPWTMGAFLNLPTPPSYCPNVVGGVVNGKIPPNGCYTDVSRLSLAHPWWPLTLLGLLVASLGVMMGSFSTRALQSRQSEVHSTIASSSQAV